jgi:hypothetical protein
VADLILVRPMRAVVSLLSVTLLSACASRPAAVYPLPGNSICEVHHIPMQTKTVPRSFGLPWYEPGYLAAERRYFPHAQDSVDGPCYYDGGPKMVRVYVCPECIRAKQRWAVRHSHYPNASSR